MSYGAVFLGGKYVKNVVIYPDYIGLNPTMLFNRFVSYLTSFKKAATCLYTFSGVNPNFSSSTFAGAE